MIGLGSNRLSVCRRGGMRVTQAGKGGMEWLAGGRRPRWSSPYSAQATAALKDAFPTQWPTIRDYGWQHPEIVPYVNANPLCAAIWCCYVQDGLVFQMDCNYECTAAKWKDVRSAIEFIGTNVQLTDGVPTFNGTASMVANTEINYPWRQCTFEVVIETADVSTVAGDSWQVFRSNKSGIVLRLKKYTYVNGPIHYGLENNQFKVGASVTSGLSGFQSYNFNGANSIYLNQRALNKDNRTDGFGGATTDTRLGEWLVGKIYAIRIYNRLLTEQEILANQAIDLQRWQPS